MLIITDRKTEAAVKSLGLFNMIFTLLPFWFLCFPRVKGGFKILRIVHNQKVDDSSFPLIMIFFLDHRFC